jgi:hypothetical protein
MGPPMAAGRCARFSTSAAACTAASRLCLQQTALILSAQTATDQQVSWQSAWHEYSRHGATDDTYEYQAMVSSCWVRSSNTHWFEVFGCSDPGTGEGARLGCVSPARLQATCSTVRV